MSAFLHLKQAGHGSGTEPESSPPISQSFRKMQDLSGRVYSLMLGLADPYLAYPNVDDPIARMGRDFLLGM